MRTNRFCCEDRVTQRRGIERLRRAAFSLLELSVVIIIVGVIAGVALGLKQSGADDCVGITKAQMKDIQGAMERYVNQNERYPYPAIRTAGVEDVKYGREVDPAELAANPGLLDATIPPVTTPPTSSVMMGALPFQALGLAPSYAGDCWGNKFTYAVTTDLTETGKFNQQLPLQTYEGIITVKADSSSAPVSVKAAYVVVSHGTNALGAVKTNYSTSSGDKKYCSLGTTLDSENCELSNAVFIAAAYNDGKDAGAKYFDDIVVFSDKKQRAVGAVCNNALPNSCMVGVASNDDGQTACGATRTWTCNGSGGGINVPCTFRNATCAACGPEPSVTALWRLYGSTSDSFIYPNGKNAVPHDNCPPGYTATALIDDNDTAHTLAEDSSSGNDRSQLCLALSEVNVQFTSTWAASCPAGTIDTGVYDSDCNDLGEHKLYEEQPQGCRYRWCLGITGTRSSEFDLNVQRANSATCPTGWTWLVGAHNNEWDVNNEDGAINRAVCVQLAYKATSSCAPCIANGQPSGGNPASCCNGDSDGNGTCGTQGSSCTPCVTFSGNETDLYGTGFAGSNTRGCWDYTHPDCRQEGDLAPCDGTNTSPPPGWAVCSGNPPACIADGAASGGNTANCCNGDSDGNGICGTQGGKQWCYKGRFALNASNATTPPGPPNCPPSASPGDPCTEPTGWFCHVRGHPVFNIELECNTSCSGPACTADGQPSGGTPASCCNGDSDGNGTCGTQATVTSCCYTSGNVDPAVRLFNGPPSQCTTVTNDDGNCNAGLQGYAGGGYWEKCGSGPCNGGGGGATAGSVVGTFGGDLVCTRGLWGANYNCNCTSAFGTCASGAGHIVTRQETSGCPANAASDCQNNGGYTASVVDCYEQCDCVCN